VCGGADCGFARAEMRESIVRLRPYSGRDALEGRSGPPSLGGAWKRVTDVIVAGVALVVLTPIMLMIAALIRVSTEEPIIHCEGLIGLGGRTFVGYKFRIPVTNAESSIGWAECLTEVLRRSSLDQLPRLFNVMRGDMSLIGPQPRAAAQLGDCFARGRECLQARPGLTGIRLSHRPTPRDWRTEIALDRYYVRNWSLRLDIALMSKAISATYRDDRTA
jgi:lipopolysaccharide/colanic/teichoic acid biosynthesis glycosyltransferase